MLCVCVRCLSGENDNTTIKTAGKSTNGNRYRYTTYIQYIACLERFACAQYTFNGCVPTVSELFMLYYSICIFELYIIVEYV